MKRNTYLLLFSFWLLSSGTGLLAQAPDKLPGLLVSTGWLEENLSDSSLVILHYGMKSDFRDEHIPGARYFSNWDIVTEDEQGRKNEFPEKKDLEKVLRAAGLNDNSRIIICYQDGNAISWAARIFLTLDYAGLGGRVAMLDGGLKAWKEEGRPVTDKADKFAEGDIEIQVREEVRISKEELVDLLKDGDALVADARPEERYYGIEEDGNATRQGHIEGAASIPFYRMTLDDANHFFKSEEDLRQHFAEHMASPDSLIIPYCGTGVWASSLYFAARHLGYRVRFYDGSFQEWAADESLPVVK